MARTREESTRREEEMTIKTRKLKDKSFGDCVRCDKAPAIVKLGDDPLCLKCFDERMSNVGGVLRNLVAELRYPVKGKGKP